MKNLPSTVLRVESFADMGGDYIEIVFKNGVVVHVCAENDGIHYYSKEAWADFENCAGPTASLLVDLGSGHHIGSESEVTAMRGTTCTKFKVNEF